MSYEGEEVTEKTGPCHPVMLSLIGKTQKGLLVVQCGKIYGLGCQELWKRKYAQLRDQGRPRGGSDSALAELELAEEKEKKRMGKGFPGGGSSSCKDSET